MLLASETSIQLTNALEKLIVFTNSCYSMLCKQ